MTIRSVYLKNVYEIDKFQRTVNKTINIAEELQKKYHFDTIAFCGMSGAAMSFLLSHWLNIPLICVRKSTDGSHFHNYWNFAEKGLVCEGNLDVKRYLILDDFIATGDTVNRIINSIRKEAPDAECVSMLMYAEPHNRNWSHPNWREPIEVVSSKIEGD